MTVLEVLNGLCVDEFQHVVVRSKCRSLGYIHICGGLRDEVIHRAGFRDIIGCSILNNVLRLTVEFDVDDVL